MLHIYNKFNVWWCSCKSLIKDMTRLTFCTIFLLLLPLLFSPFLYSNNNSKKRKTYLYQTFTHTYTSINICIWIKLKSFQLCQSTWEMCMCVPYLFDLSVWVHDTITNASFFHRVIFICMCLLSYYFSCLVLVFYKLDVVLVLFNSI